MDTWSILEVATSILNPSCQKVSHFSFFLSMSQDYNDG